MHIYKNCYWRFLLKLNPVSIKHNDLEEIKSVIKIIKITVTKFLCLLKPITFARGTLAFHETHFDATD